MFMILFIVCFSSVRLFFHILFGGCDRMVVGYTSTYMYVISTYLHLSCEFESRSWWSQHWRYNIRVLRFSPSLKLTATPRYKWNIIVESGVKNTVNQSTNYLYFALVLLANFSMDFFCRKVITWIHHQSSTSNWII
jgi:hypothetical protein